MLGLDPKASVVNVDFAAPRCPIYSRITGSTWPAVLAATRIAHRFPPHRFGKKTLIAKRAEKAALQ